MSLFLAEFSARLRRTEDTSAGQIGASAMLHGGELQRAGFTIGQVVHAYGDVCQEIAAFARLHGRHVELVFVRVRETSGCKASGRSCRPS